MPHLEFDLESELPPDRIVAALTDLPAGSNLVGKALVALIKVTRGAPPRSSIQSGLRKIAEQVPG